MLSRALANVIVQFALYFTFKFCFKSGLNGGVVSIIFSSSMLFTMGLFYRWYDQRVSGMDKIGTFFIIMCVIFIAVGAMNTEEAKKVGN